MAYVEKIKRPKLVKAIDLVVEDNARLRRKIEVQRERAVLASRDLHEVQAQLQRVREVISYYRGYQSMVTIIESLDAALADEGDSDE